MCWEAWKDNFMKNIEEFVVSRLDTIDALRGRCYPTAARAGDTEPPFVLFRVAQETYASDLDGDAGVRTATVQIELLDADNDRLCQLQQAAEAALRVVNGDFEDIYVYSSRAQRGEQDDLDMTLDLFVKNLTATVVYWR